MGLEKAQSFDGEPYLGNHMNNHANTMTTATSAGEA